MPRHSLPMAGGCGCNDEEAAVCGCRDEAEQRGLELLKKMTASGEEGEQESPAPGPASKDAEGC